MKLFDVNWARVLGDLPRWSALPVHARRILLDQLKPTGYVQSYNFGAALDAVVASGIAHYDRDRGRVTLSDEHRELVKVLRAMHRHPVFDDPSPPQLVRYIEEHFTNEDVVTIGAGATIRYQAFVNRHTLAPRIASGEWTGELLDADTDKEILAWAAARGDGAAMRMSADTLVIFRDLQALLRKLVRMPTGAPLRTIVAPLDASELARFGTALHAGLRTAAIFAGMRAGDLEPMIGLWPAAVRELTRPAPEPPTTVTATAQFTLALLMEDMTTVLAAAVAEPIRIRASDGAVYSRASAEIAKRMVSRPEWLDQVLRHPTLSRVDIAASYLSRAQLLRIGAHAENAQLTATPAGMAWLAKSAHERLASLIDPIRKSKDKNPPTAYGAGEPSFFPNSFPYYQVPKALESRSALVRSFQRAADGFIALDSFLDHASRAENPILALRQSAPNEFRELTYNNGSGSAQTNAEGLWKSMLFQFLMAHLVLLGGAAIGYLADRRLCFRLTDVGRYLIGDVDSFTYGADEEGGIVVQPNFDVVFMGAAPSTEATISRFAERVGAAPGLAFKITRASVLKAAEAGITVEGVLDTLRGASTKDLPKNVEREITGWMAIVRFARLRTVQLIECADVDAAERVQTALGQKVRRIAPTIFEIASVTAAERSTLVKRLRSHGVFLEGAWATAVPAPKRGRPVVRDDEFDDE